MFLHVSPKEILPIYSTNMYKGSLFLIKKPKFLDSLPASWDSSVPPEHPNASQSDTAAHPPPAIQKRRHFFLQQIFHTKSNISKSNWHQSQILQLGPLESPPEPHCPRHPIRGSSYHMSWPKWPPEHVSTNLLSGGSFLFNLHMTKATNGTKNWSWSCRLQLASFSIFTNNLWSVCFCGLVFSHLGFLIQRATKRLNNLAKLQSVDLTCLVNWYTKKRMIHNSWEHHHKTHLVTKMLEN